MATELLADDGFRNGFMLKGLNSLRDGHGSIRSFRLNEKEPRWYLCQWNSKYNLIDGDFTVSKDRYNICDVSKSLTVIGNRELVFELNAEKEYKTQRTESEPWPHLLIEQEITENNRVRDLKKIECSARFRLLEFKSYMQGQEKQYHAAQFVWVVTFKDANPDSPSYGSFIWVVLCPFDSRYDFAPLFTRQDKALPDGEFIYSFAGRDFLEKPLWGGDGVNLYIDLYPHIGRILACAQSHGFMQGSRAEDLVVSSTNMGFEITGTFRCRISVENPKIMIEKKEEKE